jgi:hypothetical protein
VSLLVDEGDWHSSQRSPAQKPCVALPWHTQVVALPAAPLLLAHVPWTHVSALHAALVVQLAPVYPDAHREQSSPAKYPNSPDAKQSHTFVCALHVPCPPHVVAASQRSVSSGNVTSSGTYAVSPHSSTSTTVAKSCTVPAPSTAAVPAPAPASTMMSSRTTALPLSTSQVTAAPAGADAVTMAVRVPASTLTTLAITRVLSAVRCVITKLAFAVMFSAAAVAVSVTAEPVGAPGAATERIADDPDDCSSTADPDATAQ